jgi:ADP-heptose:LPS heptosyltransferase
VHPGAASRARRWPAERWAAVASAAGERVVITGTRAERLLAQRVAAIAGLPQRAVLAGRTDLRALAAGVASARRVVSGDTGVAHLAAALGTPVVALFGPTDPALSAPRGHSVVVTNPVPCAPCFYRRCPIEHPCLRGIDADRVRTLTLSMLERAA